MSLPGRQGGDTQQQCAARVQSSGEMIMELKTLIMTLGWAGAGLGWAGESSQNVNPAPHRTQPTSPQLAHSEMVDTTSFPVNLPVRPMEYIHTTNADSPVAMSCLHHLHLHRYF